MLTLNDVITMLKVIIDGPDGSEEDREGDVHQEKKEDKSSKAVKQHINNFPSNEEIEKVDHDYTDPYPSKEEWDGK